MIDAYIFVDMQPGYSNDAISNINTITEAVKTSVISGDYDIIVRVHATDLNQLHHVSLTIQKITGVTRTITSVIEKELSI